MAEVVKLPAPKTTMTCPDCGQVEDFDRMSLMHTCGICGKTEDQDRRACRNLLASGLVAV